MGSLKLDTSSYEFSSLEKKYSNFRAPAFKILVDGKDIVQKEMMGIDNLSIESSINKADIFSFTVVNAYKYDKNNFSWVDSILKPGSKVEIKLGYVDKFVSVFDGYITGVTFEFSRNSGANLVVSGMDASFLMMKGKKSFIWTKKKHSDIVSEIAKKYKLKTDVSSTSTEFETVVQNNQSDYDFIKYLADLNSSEMFVYGSTFYFRVINKSKSASITLEMNKHLMNMTYSTDLASQIGGVVVRGYNIKKEEIEAKIEKVDSLNSDGKDGVSILSSLDGKNTMNYVYEPVVSKKEAEDIAKSLLLKKSMNYVSGNATSIGLPEISSGRYVKIKGIYGTQSRVFYITSVIHSFNGEGFTTYFEFGGNSV